MSRMGCPDISKRDIKNAKDAINRALHQACECATESCECRDVAVQAQIGAQASQVSASNSANQAQAAWNDFQTRYLGAFPTAPVTTIVGALYFNTVSNEMFVWNGATWISVSSSAIIPDGDKGDITVSGLGSTWTIDNGAVTSGKIADGTIVNADVSATAAIAGTKINPNFGSQNISSTGNVSLNGAVVASSSFGSISQGFAGPQLNLTNNFNGNGSYCPFIVINKQRGSGAVQNGDRVGSITFQGHDGTNLQAVAEINASVSGTVSSGIVPGDLRFNTTTTAGLLGTRLIIKNDGNVGIGTFTPATSALLDVSSTTKGFLPPRMTTAQRDAIPSPVEGLVVYNTTTDEINVFNGTAWASAGGGVSSFSAGTTGLTPSTATTGAVTLAGTLAVANGGTGSTTASGARTNLSAVGSDITGIGGATQLTNMMQITQAGYNAITPNANTLYVIVG